MFWQDNESQRKYQVPDTVVDLVFNINCRCLPIEHTHALSTSVLEVLPWMQDEPRAGIHMIHGAASGNGWMRPDAAQGDAVIYLSRRTRFEIRLPRERIEDAQALSGRTLDVDGYELALGDAQIRSLSTLTTLFSRHLIAEEGDDEATFLARTAEQLQALGVRFGKMLCGRSHTISLPHERLFTRSLMVAEMSVQDSVKLQQEGLGRGRTLGCGLFIPHKDIAPVRQSEE